MHQVGNKGDGHFGSVVVGNQEAGVGANMNREQ